MTGERPARERKKPDELTPDQARRLIEEADRDRAKRVAEHRERYRLLVQGKRDERVEPVTAWLLLRYQAGDLGIRPLPPNQVFWASPDIWVDSTSPLGNPVAGQPNIVHARLFNLGGFMASPVKVDYYWGNPAVGLGPDTMHLIGTEYVALPPVSSLDVPCPNPWVPEVDGHECVIVQCSNWLLDPMTHPFQSPLDRHVGQRNLYVEVGAPGTSLSLTLDVLNVFPMAVAFSIEAEVQALRIIRGADQPALLALGRAAATVAQWSAGRPSAVAGQYIRHSPAHRAAQRGLVVERREGEAEPPPFEALRSAERPVQLRAAFGPEDTTAARAEHTFGAQLLRGLEQFNPAVVRTAPAAQPLETATMGAHSRRALQVDLTMPSQAADGEIIVVHLRQRMGPFVIGGYTLIFIVR